MSLTGFQKNRLKGRLWLIKKLLNGEKNIKLEKLKFQMRASGIKGIPRGIRKSTRENPANLTLRELGILRLLSEGMQNKEIAGKLFISPKTVDHHISSILFKLDVNSRTRAVKQAHERGILK